MGWADTEFETIDLGDERRNKRAIRLVERLSAQPTASVPQACGDWADTMAAYRFVNNEEIDWRAILGAHTDCAKTRMAGQRSTTMAFTTSAIGRRVKTWGLAQKIPGVIPCRSPDSTGQSFKAVLCRIFLPSMYARLRCWYRPPGPAIRRSCPAPISAMPLTALSRRRDYAISP